MPQFVTEGVAGYASGVSPGDEQFYRTALRKGAVWLHRAGVETRSDDLMMLSYLVYRGMSELYRDGRPLGDDYIVAGDVLDCYVTDGDAELLVEVCPELRRFLDAPVGSMTVEVTAIHGLLLEVAGAMRERWEREG